MADTTETRTEKGISLARGPALILGTILLAAGLYFLYKEHFFPKFSNFPNGSAPVEGKVFGTFGANGWTGMLTAVAGGLLLFGAAQHLLAKTMSLIVGIALGAAAVIALISGDVLGLAAANGWTELAWGIAAAILLFNTLIPRRRRTVAPAYEPAGRRGRAGTTTAAGAGAAGGTAVGGREARSAGAAEPEPVPAGSEDRTAVHRDEPGAVADDDEAATEVHRDEPVTAAHGGEPATAPNGNEAATEVQRDEPGTSVDGGADADSLDAPERRVRSGDDPA
jgi:hypothetical protein